MNRLPENPLEFMEAGKRLGQNAGSPQSQQVFGRVSAGAATHKTTAHLGIDLPQAQQRVRTVESGHLHIEENQSDGLLMLLVHGHCLRATPRQPDAKAEPPQGYLEEPADRFFIVHHQNLRLVCWGRS